VVLGGIKTMSLTITLNKELAQRLRAQAEVRKLSVQQWALAILANAAQRPDCPETWTELNGQRLALIRKRYAGGLNEAEDRKLAALQAAAAEVFEPADRQRSAYIRSLVQGVGGSSDE
jgi:hypothetical protein